MQPLCAPLAMQFWLQRGYILVWYKKKKKDISWRNFVEFSLTFRLPDWSLVNGSFTNILIFIGTKQTLLSILGTKGAYEGFGIASWRLVGGSDGGYNYRLNFTCCRLLQYVKSIPVSLGPSHVSIKNKMKLAGLKLLSTTNLYFKWSHAIFTVYKPIQARHWPLTNIL